MCRPIMSHSEDLAGILPVWRARSKCTSAPCRKPRRGGFAERSASAERAGDVVTAFGTSRLGAPLRKASASRLTVGRTLIQFRIANCLPSSIYVVIHSEKLSARHESANPISHLIVGSFSTRNHHLVGVRRPVSRLAVLPGPADQRGFHD